jgi:hypothetical protein
VQPEVLTGPTGPKGDTGDTGKTFHIFATIDSSANSSFVDLDPSDNHIGEFVLTTWW